MAIHRNMHSYDLHVTYMCYTNSTCMQPVAGFLELVLSAFVRINLTVVCINVFCVFAILLMVLNDGNSTVYLCLMSSVIHTPHPLLKLKHSDLLPVNGGLEEQFTVVGLATVYMHLC